MRVDRSAKACRGEGIAGIAGIAAMAAQPAAQPPLAPRRGGGPTWIEGEQGGLGERENGERSALPCTSVMLEFAYICRKDTYPYINIFA